MILDIEKHSVFKNVVITAEVITAEKMSIKFKNKIAKITVV